MHDIEDHLTSLVKSSAKAPEDLYEHIQAFSAAISWDKDSWIYYIGIFHATLWLLFIIFRKNVTFQMVLFLIVIVLVGASERINSFASTHWREFSSQNYFDIHGLFIGVLFAGPLLVLGFTQLVNRPTQ